MNFTMTNMIGGFLFGGIGFVAFVYGKKMGQLKTLLLGLALMGFPYFVTDTLWMYVVGVGLTAAIFIFKD